MKFYGREEEIAILRKERELSHRQSRFTVVTGRRRVGKTELIDKALNDGTDDYLYLLFSRKNEKSLCRELLEAIEDQMGDRLPPLGNPERVAQLLRELVKVSRTRPFTIVLDEFQEMDVVNSGFYGELQGIWDKAQHGKLNLVVSGSVNRMMSKIMFNSGEPLFGRNTAHLQLKPFSVALLKKIFAAHCPKYRREDLLDLWAITGGVARYVALLMDGGAFTRKAMLNLVFSPASPFLEEGRIVLAQEFGGDSTNYFSILSSIATGHTRYSEIECDLSLELGSFITNLEKNYHLVKRILPVYASRGAKNAAYRIEDPFFRFCFRYIFRNAQLVELERFETLRKMVAEDLDTFTGQSLEQYFWWKFVKESDYVSMGAWWDRKGENEIDLVCESPAVKKRPSALTFFEVKRDAARIDLKALETKVAAFFEKHPTLRNYKVSCRGLSLADM